MNLLDQVRQVMRVQHLSYRTEQPYVQWIERFIRHSHTKEGWRHPSSMDAPAERDDSSVFTQPFPSIEQAGQFRAVLVGERVARAEGVEHLDHDLAHLARRESEIEFRRREEHRQPLLVTLSGRE